MPRLLHHTFGVAQQTGRLVSISQIHELRNGLSTTVPLLETAGMKRAPGRHGRRVGHIAFKNYALGGCSRLRNGNRCAYLNRESVVTDS